jgi:capsular polysaccharide biosynthesis protein
MALLQKKIDGNLNLRKIVLLCRNHILFLIFLTIFAGAVGFAVAKYALVPKYTSSTQVLVHRKDPRPKDTNVNNQQAYTNQQADVQMINTYKDLIVSRSVLTKVVDKLNDSQNGELTVGHLQKEISITNKQNSQIFTISVTDSNSKDSMLIANLLTSTFIKQSKKIMNTNNVTVVSKAVKPEKPSFPNIKTFVAGGAFLGLFLGFLYITISYWLKELDPQNDLTMGKHVIR